MKLIIDIPEEEYELVRHGNKSYTTELELMNAVTKGIPLPEHGDLIDKDRLLDELEKTVKSVDDTNRHLLFWDRAVAHVHLSKPIIEANKESKE